MSMLDRYRGAEALKRPVVIPTARTRMSLRERLSGGAVEWSQDLERILALPRREKPELEPIVRDLTARLKRPEGTQSLRPIQAWVLDEACMLGGVIAQASPGSGKCVDADTEVFDVGAGRRRKACELGEFTTYAKDKDGKFVLAKATAFESGTKFCVRLVLANGSAVVLSVDHPVFTQRGWIQACALQDTDLIATPRVIPSPITPLVVSDDEVKLAAYIIADGSVTTGSTYFTDDDPKTVAEVLDLAARLSDSSRNAGIFGNLYLGIDGPVEKKSKSNAREFNLRGLSWFRRKWGINGLSKHKRVPAEFWGLSNDQTALFLNRFVACDGHVGTRVIEITLASERLIDDLRFMFLRLGVMSRKAFKKAKIKNTVYDAWRMTISGEDVDRFFSTVGVVLGSEERSEKLIESRRRSIANTNTDIVPIGSAERTLIADEMGWPGVGKQPRNAIKPRLRGKFQQATHSAGYPSRSRFAKACADFGYRGSLSWLADSDLAWERIKNIESVGHRPVYDLSVPGPHNFIGDGIVLHNTLMGMLLPMCIPNCERAVLLIPSDLRPQFHANWITYGQHWKLPNLAGGSSFIPGRPVLHLISYSEFSHKKGTDLLRRINPDLVMGDELQCVKNFESSRGSRFFSHFVDHEHARLAGWTGSLGAESMADFAHFFAIALMNGSPCPIEPRAVKEWARALDPDQLNCLEPGLLMKFCTPGEDVRSGIRRRMVDTAGFVSSGVDELPKMPLVFIKRTPPPMPQKVLEAYKTLKRKDESIGGWKRPDGEVLTDQLEVVSCARQLSIGLYLRWIFPRGEPRELIDTWYEVRQSWNRELRAQLNSSRQVFMDSPALCEEAAIRYYDGGCETCTRGPEEQHVLGCKSAERLPLWDPFSYPAWRIIENQVYHETQTVWMDDWLIQDAAAWAKEHIGIIWVEHPEAGLRLAELAGIPYYGEGDEAHHAILTETGNRSIVCSIDAHHKGINLQCFNEMLIMQMPSSNTLVEQAVARAHRDGQTADRVSVFYYIHTIELEHSLEKAMERARFVQDVLNSPQKLNYTHWETIINAAQQGAGHGEK